MRIRHDLDGDPSFRAGPHAGSLSAGKASMTQRLVRGRPLAAAPAPAVQRAVDPAVAAVQRRQLARDLDAAMGFFDEPADLVQRHGDAHTGLPDDAIAAYAAQGTSGSGGVLPHLETIQRAFGPTHDLSGVRAHVGGAAAQAADAIGAHAYATGNDVAFASSPDLFLAAHEATHVIQQRQGVHLKGAVGQAGDRYEAHADAVAAAVVRGESVADLLGPGASTGDAAIQRKGKGKASGSSSDLPPPRRRGVEKELHVALGATFHIPFEAGQSVAWDESGHLECKDGSTSPAGFRATQEGTTKITVVDEAEHTIAVYNVHIAKASGHEGALAVAQGTGAPIAKGGTTRLTDTNEVRFTYQFAEVPVKDGLTIKSSETVNAGSEAACKLSTGRWLDDRTLIWTAKVTRPVTSTFHFEVLDAGKAFFKDDVKITFELDAEMVPRVEAEHMIKNGNDKRTYIVDYLQRWRTTTAQRFIEAKLAVNKLIQDDIDAGAKVDALAMGVLTAVVGAAVGAWVGPAFAGWLGAVDGTFAAEAASDLAKTGVAKAVEGIGVYAAPPNPSGLSENETLAFIKYDKQCQALTRALLQRSRDAYMTDDEGRHIYKEDPIAVADQFAKDFGLPLAEESQEQVERRLWIAWLKDNGAHASQAMRDDANTEFLESGFTGTNYTNVMRRLTELHIAHTHPDDDYTTMMDVIRQYDKKDKALANHLEDREEIAEDLVAEAKHGKRLDADMAKRRAEEKKLFDKDLKQKNE